MTYTSLLTNKIPTRKWWVLCRDLKGAGWTLHSANSFSNTDCLLNPRIEFFF